MFDFDNIAGLQRGATFVANEVNSARDFLQDFYIFNIADPLTFECPPPFFGFPPSNLNAPWSPAGVDPHTLNLRTETLWDDSGFTPADDPTKEGLAGETLADYATRVGTPDFLVCTGFGSVQYQGYFGDCDNFVDPGFPAFGIELDGEGVAFGSGERGLLALGINAEGAHGQGALSVAVAKATASYLGDPTNDATLCLFTWAELVQAVLYFEPGYTAHRLSTDLGERAFFVQTYYPLSLETRNPGAFTIGDPVSGWLRERNRVFGASLPAAPDAVGNAWDGSTDGVGSSSADDGVGGVVR